ncbi:MAG: GNAT family N-acetyltransferase [Marinifilaceae bacterium]|jgi:RimJ/RimL family protein N-acetyltransferase/dihydrofolate reductase|nr:GNAT family N-acetyltransferase [Marinifilaceae bacterium]
MNNIFSQYIDLETNNIILKEITQNDINRILELRSDDELMKYMGVEKLNSMEEAKDYINSEITEKQCKQKLSWGIYKKEKPEYLIGSVELFAYNEDFNSSMIAYYLDSEFRNRGYAKQILKQVMTYGFETLKINLIEAMIDPRNTASINLVKSLQFEFNRYNEQNYIFQQNRINFLSEYNENKRKIKIMTTLSLNGKIADSNGNNNWLNEIPNPEGTDYDFDEFYNSIDTIILDEDSYKTIISTNEFIPHMDKELFVFVSNKENYTNKDRVHFYNYKELKILKSLSQEEGQDIWVLSNGYINKILIKNNLIDELILYLFPAIITKGIDITELIPMEKFFTLKSGKTFQSGIVQLKYISGKFN